MNKERDGDALRYRFTPRGYIAGSGWATEDGYAVVKDDQGHEQTFQLPRRLRRRLKREKRT